MATTQDQLDESTFQKRGKPRIEIRNPKSIRLFSAFTKPHKCLQITRPQPLHACSVACRGGPFSQPSGSETTWDPKGPKWLALENGTKDQHLRFFPGGRTIRPTATWAMPARHCLISPGTPGNQGEGEAKLRPLAGKTIQLNPIVYAQRQYLRIASHQLTWNLTGGARKKDRGFPRPHSHLPC